MTSPASDWRKPEVLWKMHKDPAFLESVAEQLVDLAKVSEKVIARIERKKK
jgi:inactivated superfamily I helicase